MMQFTNKWLLLYHILDVDSIVLQSLIKLLDGSPVQLIFWFRNFIENTSEEIKTSYNFFLEMFKNYRDYQNDFTQAIKYLNDMSEIIESKDFLEKFVQTMQENNFLEK